MWPSDLHKFGSGVTVFDHTATTNSQVYRDAFHLGTDSTVFHAEVFAIKKAADWLLGNHSGSEAIIFMDSRAALMALDQLSTKSKLRPL